MFACLQYFCIESRKNVLLMQIGVEIVRDNVN